METAINAAIANYCRDHGYERALEAFIKETALVEHRRDENSTTLEQKFYLTAKLQTSLHLLERNQSSLIQQLRAFCGLAYGDDDCPPPGDASELESGELAFSQHCSTTDPDAVSLVEVSSVLPIFVIVTTENQVMCKKLSGSLLWTLSFDAAVSCIAISPNGCSLAIGFDDGHIEYFENIVSVTKQGPTKSYDVSAKRCKSIRLSDARIIALTAQAEFVVCSIVDGSILRHIPLMFNVSSWDLDIEDGLIVAGTDEGKILCWDWTAGVEFCLFAGDQHARKADFVRLVANRLVATACRDGQPEIWRIVGTERLEHVKTLIFHSNWIIGITAYSRGILTMSDDGRIALWCRNTFKQIGEAKIAPCTKFKISHGATWLASLTGTKLQLYQRPLKTRTKSTQHAARKIVNQQLAADSVVVTPRDENRIRSEKHTPSPTATKPTGKEAILVSERKENISVKQENSDKNLNFRQDDLGQDNRSPHRQGTDQKLDTISRQTTINASVTTSSEETIIVAKRDTSTKSTNQSDRVFEEHSPLKLDASNSTSIISRERTKLEKTSSKDISNANPTRHTEPESRSRKYTAGPEIKHGSGLSVQQDAAQTRQNQSLRRDTTPKLSRQTDNATKTSTTDPRPRQPEPKSHQPMDSLLGDTDSKVRPVTARTTFANPSTARTRLKPTPQSTTAVTPVQRMNIAQRLELEVKAAQAQLINDGKAPQKLGLNASGSTKLGGKSSRSSLLESKGLPDRASQLRKSTTAASGESTPHSGAVQSGGIKELGCGTAMTQRSQVSKKDSLLAVDPTVSRLLQSSRRSTKVKAQPGGD